VMYIVKKELHFWHGDRTLLLHPIVLFHNFLQFLVWQGFRADSLVPCHVIRCNHGIDNSFLGGIRRSHEQGIDEIIAESLDRRDAVFIPKRGIRIRGGECQENISRAVAAK